MADQQWPVVALGTDRWNASRHQNGVVSYTTNMVEGMHQLGARAYVIANHAEPAGDGEFVREVPSWGDIQRGGIDRVLAGLGRRLVPDYTDGRLLAERLLHVLTRVHRNDGIEVFETEESNGVARLVIPRSPVPVVVRLHGPWFLVGPAVGVDQDAAYRRRLRREQLALERAAGVSAPSQDVIDRTRAFYGMELRRGRVIPNPVRIVPRSRRWNIRQCDPDRLLFVGRFDLGKGADVLLEAFGRVLRERPSARLTLVGQDHGISDEHGVMVKAEAYINRRFSDPFPRSRIERVGLQSPDELLALRRQSFVCVVASRYESFSMVTLEAMAAGCPVVATRVGGVPEIVHHRRNGLLVRPGHPGELADAILRLMSRPAMAETLGEQAARDAAEGYSPGCIARQTMDLYQEILLERASGPTP